MEAHEYGEEEEELFDWWTNKPILPSDQECCQQSDTGEECIYKNRRACPKIRG
jgi:hypothetical protein